MSSPAILILHANHLVWPIALLFTDVVILGLAVVDFEDMHCSASYLCSDRVVSLDCYGCRFAGEFGRLVEIGG